MQIVIDIDEKRFRDIQRISTVQLKRRTPTLEQVIATGILLPKGHGDIVDIETLIDMFWDGNSMEITKYDLCVIEPIIKADKESEE